ncbi:MAG: tetratricopeptide repeat protein [Candidatus Omnitrophica bacterium]|nr:tetratricopeptide repeat protein [Candidatus Omnitrophota bacterium]
MAASKPLLFKIPLKQKIALILFGLFLFILALEAGLRLGGAILSSIQEYRNLQSIKQKGTYRILCLGESTTGGQYPRFLEEALNRSNIGIKFSVIDDGAAGFNTKTIVSKLEANLDKYKPQMVIAMMGINDGGERVFWENRVSAKALSFLESFKVYKLARLIYLHAQNKFKRKEPHKLKTSQAAFHRKQNYFSKICLNMVYAAPIPEENAPGLGLKNDEEYVEDAELYSIAGRFADAESSFKKAIAINPRNNAAYGLLIKLYWDYKYFSQSEDFFKEAIKVNPSNADAYYWMAIGYRLRQKYSLAEDLFNKALKINPDDLQIVAELILVYRCQGKYSEIENLLNKYLDKGLKSDYLYGMLGAFYSQSGEGKFADRYYKESNRLRMQYYNPTTRSNYLKLRSVLDKRGIKLACMQYPVRSVKPLKDIFPDCEGILFIDNEKVFKDALHGNGYAALFKDSFAGDFGHCTDKGNQLLAQHAADVILKEVFGQ